MKCPLTKEDCLEKGCAWWQELLSEVQPNQCAILDLTLSLRSICDHLDAIRVNMLD